MTLTRRQRSLVLFFSASSYLAWFSGVGDRLDAEGIVGTPMPSMTIVPRSAPPRVNAIIRRDPFAGAPAPRDGGADAPSHDRTYNADSSAPALGGPAPAGVVPDIAGAPPAGIDARPQEAPLTLVVRATITGPNPVAYVANGTMMDIVRIGDRLGDRRVAKIDLRGLAFADGSRLDLPGNFEAPRAPVRAAAGVTIKLDDLRKLLLGTRGESPLAPPAGANPATVTNPMPVPTGTFPTPGPLPTVNQRGVPVGTNPTFDPSAPTPYPEAYPYAPPARRP